MNERDIFEKAIEIQDRKQRDAFLDLACGGDAALRQRLNELLASHDAATGFLKVPVVNQLPPTKLSEPPATLELSPQAVAKKHETARDESDDDQDDDASITTDLSFLQASSKPGSIGRLGHYEILQVLGQGAFGIVFKAFDEKLHRHVAIKAMNPQLASTSPPRKRFLREARSVAAIKHENIVQVHSVEEQPLPYLAMEFVDGQTLAQKLETAGPLEAPEILHLGRQMAAGLAAAHEKGLIHRDIKPGNILIEAGAEQKVKITDFGLARAADDATMTRTGTIAGTPMFMSPEQAMGQTLDHRSDLFSLGGVLYQMACGRPPFRGANAIAVLKRVVDESPRPIRDVLPDVPEWLCAIIEKLHAKSPDERYQTAKEVADLLARCQNELQVTGKVTCVPVRGQSASKASKTPTTVEAPAVTQARRSAAPSSNRPLVAVAAVALLAIGGVTVTEFAGITSFLRKPNIEPVPVASGKSSDDAAITKVQTSKATGWAGWPADAPKPAIAPFDVEQAKKHQEEWAKYLNVPVEYTNSIGMKFRLIPPGEFTMGSTPEEIEETLKHVDPNDKHGNDCIRSEGPQHKVILTQAIYLGVHEVTQKEYATLMGTNPSHFSSAGTGKESVADLETQNYPVEMVSWNDAAEFCAKLSQKDDLKPFYFRAGNTITPLDGTGYRLPSEAEWEFACRAGTITKYWIGDKAKSLMLAGWLPGNSGSRTHAVGELRANPFGLTDIHGNVSEWVEDAWFSKDDELSAGEPHVNPIEKSTADSWKLIRGGYWEVFDLSASRSASRYSHKPTARGYDIGFRIALPTDAVKESLRRQVAATLDNNSWAGWPADAPKPAIAPFDAEQAKKHQEEWAAYLKVPVEYTNSIGMKFRLIPPGEFTMGMAKEEAEAIAALKPNDEHWKTIAFSSTPSHKVRLTPAFYLGTYEVTQAQYEKVFGANPSHFSASGEGKELVKNEDPRQHPVEMVPYIDAAEFCIKLSEQERLKPVYFSANNVITLLTGVGYRLPTEAEWEHACRAGTNTAWFSGEQESTLGTVAWWAGNSGGRTHAVGQLKANPFGLYDVHGNLWEWCQDWQDLQVYSTRGGGVAEDPQGPDAGLGHVFRGGVWDGPSSLCRSASRFAYDIGYRSNFVGFRVSLSVDAVRQALGVTGPAIPKTTLVSSERRDSVNGSTNKPLTVTSSATDDAVDYAAERKAAEWVLKVGGTLYLADEQGKPLRVVDGKLPVASFAVIGVSIFNQQSLKDEDLAVLAGCRQLQNVTLVGSSGVTDTGVRQMELKAPLNHLNLDGTQITDTSISLIVENQSLRESLRGIAIRGTQVTDGGLRKLAEHRRLQELWIGSKSITRQGIQAAVMGNPDLRILQFTGESPDDALRGLAKHPTLFQFDIVARQLDDPAVEVMQSLPKFGSLSIAEMDEATFDRIAKLSQLKSLMLHTGSISSRNLEKLAVLPALSHLEARGESFDDACLAVLEKWPALRSVHLHAMPRVTEAALARFRQSRPDVHLNIDGKDYPATK